MDKDEKKLRRFNLASRIQTIYIMDYVGNNYSRILDLCAGDGDLSVILSKRAGTVCSVDNDTVRIERIKQNIKKNQISNVVVVNNSADDLSFPDNYFDMVVCNSALEHISSYKQVISEIYRVLSPNGYLILTVPNMEIQFGNRFSLFWNSVIRFPYAIKKRICRSEELARYNSIKDLHAYYNCFFSHRISFSENKIKTEVQPMFRIINVRHYMNYLGAFGHDCAYYFRWGKNMALLQLCLIICQAEHRFLLNSKGKGILLVCQTTKPNTNH